MVGKFARTALVSLALAFGGVSASPSCEYKIVESSILENGTIVQLSLTNTTSSAWAVGQQFQLDLGSPNLLDIDFFPENSVDIIDNSESIYTFEVLETPNDSVVQMIAERECSESSDDDDEDGSSTAAAACSTSISVICKDGSQESTTPAAEVLSVNRDNADDSEFGPLGLWHTWRLHKRHRRWGHRYGRGYRYGRGHRYRRPRAPRRCQQPPNHGKALICPVDVKHTLVQAVPCKGATPYASYILPHHLWGFPTGALDWEWSRFTEWSNGQAAITGVLFNAKVRFEVYLLLKGRQFNENGLNPIKENRGHCNQFDTSSWYFYRHVSGWMWNLKTWKKFTLSNKGTRPAQIGTGANVKNGNRGLAIWLKASSGSGQKAGIDFNSDIVCKS